MLNDGFPSFFGMRLEPMFQLSEWRYTGLAIWLYVPSVEFQGMFSIVLKVQQDYGARPQAFRQRSWDFRGMAAA